MTRRRVSAPRLLLLIIIAAALGVGGVVGVQWVQNAFASRATPWFAGYVDATATPDYAFETPTGTEEQNVVLSFVVADPDSPCTPSWGAAYTLDQASDSLDLDRRIALLRQHGGDIAISFGGQANDELATVCTDQTSLEAAYRSVIDRYDVSTIDVDVEGTALENSASATLRAKTLAALQAEQRAAGKSLAIWLTLPVTPSGLSTDGQQVVKAMLDAGVDLAGVNAMTMDYGSSLGDQSLVDAGKSALVSLQRQLKALYTTETDLTLSDATLWSKVGATPMIGQNDVQDEVFTTDDAEAFNQMAVDLGIGRMSMWSLNRDQTCGSNYVTLSVVSDACSGVDQGDASFAALLGATFTGSPQFSADQVTTSEPVATEAPDDPATSPYQIWDENAAYLQGTKVVWHHYVYEAKWWTSGDLPDNPVLNEWDTPWKLIGPVLPGETPVPVPTLPAGTYPDWSGSAVYNKGDRVLLDDVPYEAKWWTQGDSPEAASSDPDNSPWVALTTDQIQKVLDGDGDSTTTPAPDGTTATPTP